MIETDAERYADPQTFAREVNLPLLGAGGVAPIPAGAGIGRLLAVQPSSDLASVVDGLHETRRSLSLRSLLLAGFPEDRECFAVGLALAREWSRRGLTLAVVDLDFWHPTVVRPLPHPNEGLVDVLEYGCSFRRVAWEIVAGALWVVGPGSHPPDPDRLVHHPDWQRAARSFAAHADVTLYVAPLFHRSGFVGRLSKRMDGVLLAASVERVGRSDLRDAFLELWGSDAPIIGCVGIDPSTSEAYPVVESPEARAGALVEPDQDTDPPSAAETQPALVLPAREEEVGSDPIEDHLSAILDREIRFGEPTAKRIRRSRLPLVAGVSAGIAIAASILAIITHHPTLPRAEETMPAGTERVLPADPEAPVPAGLGSATSSLEAPPGSELAPPQSPPQPSAPPRSAQPKEAAPATDQAPFRVHVASFKSEQKVRGIVRDLKAHGADAWYERAATPHGYYRVFVGHFATKSEARAQARWLLEKGWVDRAQAYPPTGR